MLSRGMPLEHAQDLSWKSNSSDNFRSTTSRKTRSSPSGRRQTTATAAATWRPSCASIAISSQSSTSSRPCPTTSAMSRPVAVVRETTSCRCVQVTRERDGSVLFCSLMNDRLPGFWHSFEANEPDSCILDCSLLADRSIETGLTNAYLIPSG